MKIKLHEIAVKDVYNGYNDYGEDNGVVGYDGKLNIRPRCQRNFTDKDDENYNSSSMSKEIKQLMDDPEVTSKRGIWAYELAKGIDKPNAIKNLSLRTFDRRDAKRKYDEQTTKAKTDGTSNCPYCTKEGLDTIWKLSEMQADHIIPWSKGGKTEYNNLQMLCKKHNESGGLIECRKMLV